MAVGLAAGSGEEMLSRLVDLVRDRLPLSAEETVRLLAERERQAPTAISGGVAVPHLRVKGLDSFILAAGVSSDGVDFGAEDGPSRVFFLIVAPAGDTAGHLRLLARIARMVRKADFRERLVGARTDGELYELIVEEDEKV